MLYLMKKIILCIILFSWLCFWGRGITLAQEMSGLRGWELGSPYNKLYNASEVDSIKAVVEDIKEVVPIEGMSPGLAIVVRESKTETVLVHLGPASFMNSKGIGLKKGDKVKIRGVWTEINGKDVFMASKIKKGAFFSIKVRLTKDGTPFWTMDPERLAKERAAE